MTRRAYIERILRMIYGGYASDDSTITYLLVNTWLNAAIALAAKQCYKDSLAIDSVGYVNNSFYTTFKDLAISDNSNFSWKVTLPQIPLGIGQTAGISQLRIKDSNGFISQACIPISQNQLGYYQGLRQPPNAVLFYPEGTFVYIITTLILFNYTANVTMISGGDKTNLDSIINVPEDYFNIITEYIKQQLIFERNQPVDSQNDGSDVIKST